LRVAITRPRERAEGTIELLKARGWEAVIVPTVEIKPREGALRGVDLRAYDWLILTSASGAEIAYEHFGEAMKGVKIACIGPKTAESLEKKGLRVAYMPEKYAAGSLARGLLSLVEGGKILVARASIGRDILVQELRKKAEVTEVPLYDTVMVSDTSGIEAFSKLLDKDSIDAIIFTSSQAAKNLLSSLSKAKLRKLDEITVCAIGPITAAALRERDIGVDVMPEEYTVKACLDEIEGRGDEAGSN
jgi:uroporphyrinogen III methyltransferase/synthase